jgi:hypothetical protein
MEQNRHISRLCEPSRTCSDPIGGLGNRGGILLRTQKHDKSCAVESRPLVASFMPCIYGDKQIGRIEPHFTTHAAR